MQQVPPISDQTSLLQSLLASSGDCIKILGLDGSLLFMTDTGQRIMEVQDFAAIQSCPWPDFWEGQGHEDAKAAVAAALAGGTGHFIGPANTMAGTAKFWDVTVTLIRDSEGRPDKLLSVSRDITAAHEARRLIKENQQRLGLALASADTGTWDLDVQNDVLTWDDRCYELFGLTPGTPISFARFLEGIRRSDRAATEQACLEAMRPGGPGAYDIEYRTIGLEDGIERWCAAKGRSFFADGRCVRFIGTIRDIGALKLAEQQTALLTHELEHRLKNTLAMVGAIAAQTFRTAPTKEDAARIFDARLAALSRAHNVLTRSSWSQASMPVVVEEALHMHRAGDERIRIAGPPVDLSSKQALSLALALHELATNAAKYGALSVDKGTVDVDWEVQPSGDGRRLRFRWEEKGGPSLSPPTRKGFGSRLIEATLTNDFGPVKIEYAPPGLVCSFECPIGEPSK